MVTEHPFMIIDDLGMADDQISWVIPWINGPIL
jgi:hypothetical protein